jgi:hypothetical protein
MSCAKVSRNKLVQRSEIGNQLCKGLPSRPNDFRRNFLKRYNLKPAMDAGFECSKGLIAGFRRSEVLPERAPDPEPSGYAALRDRVFIQLVTFTLKEQRRWFSAHKIEYLRIG